MHCLNDVLFQSLFAGSQTADVKLSTKIPGTLPAPENQAALKAQIVTDVSIFECHLCTL